ncbi:hypothetical protein PUN28_011972 [Cardiocondyla obscurior]|uniref:Uncharacterized protein n=1 Tax=Cardiocondyla obscurior TaxID=286306 RepID=A0AAW2FCM3_9HYME
MSRKKVWNSIMRRKKKNLLDLNSTDENSLGNVSPLLRVSTLPRRGSQHRHTLDPELSSLREHDNNHLFVECESKSQSLPRGFPPQIIIQHIDDEGKI